MFYINNEIKSGIGHDGPNVDVSKLIEAYKWKFGKVTSGEKLILQSLSAQLGAGDPFNPEEYSKVFSGSKMSCMSGIKKTAYAASALGIGFFAALLFSIDMLVNVVGGIVLTEPYSTFFLLLAVLTYYTKIEYKYLFSFG